MVLYGQRGLRKSRSGGALVDDGGGARTASKWNGCNPVNPAIGRLRHALDSVVLSAAGPEWAIAAALDRALSALSQGDLLSAIEWADCSAGDEATKDALQGLTGLPAGGRRNRVILQHPYALVSGALLTPGTITATWIAEAVRPFTFSERVTVTRFVRSGGAVLRFWDRVEGRCRALPACYRPVDGDQLVLDGRKRGWSIETAEGNVAVITAHIHPIAEAEIERMVGADVLEEIAP